MARHLFSFRTLGSDIAKNKQMSRFQFYDLIKEDRCGLLVVMRFKETTFSIHIGACVSLIIAIER